MYKVYDSASQTKCKSLISRSWNLPLNFVSVPCLLNCFETQVRPGPGGGGGGADFIFGLNTVEGGYTIQIVENTYQGKCCSPLIVSSFSIT